MLKEEIAELTTENLTLKLRLDTKDTEYKEQKEDMKKTKKK